MLFSQFNVRIPHTEDQLKQVYVYNQLPQKSDFETQRKYLFDTIVDQITKVNPNVLLICGGDYIFLLQRYKHLYGLRSEQVRVLISLFTNLLFGNIQMPLQIKTYLVKVLAFLFELQIQIKNLQIDNRVILNHFKQLTKINHLHQTKSFQTYIYEFSYLAYLMAEYGNDITQQVFDFAVQKRQIRYIALFVKSLKDKSNAEMLLRQIFEPNGFWDQDMNWLHILQTIIKKFPELDFARRYQAIFLSIIKMVSQTLKSSDPEGSSIYQQQMFGVPTPSRSISKIIVNLIVPANKPYHNQIWMYIQRLINLSLSPLSPNNQHLGCVGMVIFIKNFIKMFIIRENSQNQQYQYLINDDGVNNTSIRIQSVADENSNKLDKQCLQKFDKIARAVIQKYLYIQGPVKDIETIMNLLATFSEDYHLLILNQIQYILNRDQQLIINTAVSVLNDLLELSIVINTDRIDNIIDIVRSLLQIIDKKGLNDNIHLLEIILKMFIYFPKDKPSLDSIKQQLLEIIITSIDTISTVYNTLKQEQSELYIDFNNLFNPLFFSLDQNQLDKFRQRLIYHVLNGVKKHSQGYQKLLMIYSYIDPTFPDQIVDKIFKIILKQQKCPTFYFLQQTPFSLQVQNKETIHWYVSILQCTLQYNPQAIVKYWNKLDQLISSMLKNSKKQIFESGYGMMFNIVVSLTQRELPVIDFQDQKNYNYQSLKLHWKQPQPQAIQLIVKIVKKYVYNAIDFIKNRYKTKWNDKYTHSQLIDGILVHLSSNQHVTQQRKLLQRTISIIESVVESIFPNLKVKQCQDSHNLQRFRYGDYFEELDTLTDDVIKFLEDVMHLSNTFGFLSDPDYSKIFYNFYMDMHGNLYIADMLVSAQSVLKKLRPWSKTRSNSVTPSQYLLIGQVVFSYYLRIDFFNSILPFNKLYPDCLWNLMVLDHQQSIKVQQKIIDPYNPQIFHIRHKKILQIWFQKLNPNNPQSYISKAINPSITKNQKQRYQKAIFDLIIMFKKLSQYLNLSCCVQDPSIHWLIFQISKSYKHLQKKKDRVTMLNHMFSIYTVQFQFNFILRQQNQQQTLLKILQNPNRISKIDSDFYDSILQKTRQSNQTVINQPTFIKEANEKMIIQIKKIIQQSITLLTSQNESQQKYLCLITLFMIMYSRFLKDDDQLLSQIFLTVEKTSQSPVPQIHRMGRVGVFHLINRLQRNNFKIYRVDNVVAQTNYQQFLTERNFNAPKDKPVGTTFCHKYKYMFFDYPYIEGGQETHLINKQKLFPIQRTILEFASDHQRMATWYEYCLTDQQFTKAQQSDQLIDNCQTILNYLLDKDPLKVNIFGDLTETFQMYALNFYYRITKKICQLTGKVGVESCQKVAQFLKNKQQDQYQMMYCNVSTGILKLSSQEFVNTYLQALTSCNNQIFLYHLSGLYQIFKQNPFTIKSLYHKIVSRLRQEKGIGRLRHIDVWKMFVLSQGRWARDQAIDGFKHLFKGIEQSSVETAEAIVSCIVECFTVTINLELMTKKIPDTVSDLVKQKKLFKINERVGFQINPMLKKMTQLIDSKIQEQKQLQSEGLKIYTKISTKIFDSLFVYQFNDYFYDMLETIIKHLVEKPIEQVSEIEIIKRLGDGQYPYNIYKKLKAFLEDLANKSPIIVRKKLRLLEMIMFNRGYSTNQIETPNIFNDMSNLTINHVITASNVFKAMTPQQMQNKAQGLIQSTSQDRYPLLMALIMASGNELYQWKQKGLKVVVGWKMKKLVKQFVSTWWKGKGEGCQGEQSLAMLVRNVGNPYNYLA